MTPERQTPITTNEHFEPVGYRRQSFFFRVKRSGETLKLDLRWLARPLSLAQLAPLDFWERHYIHPDGGRLHRFAILSDLIDAGFGAGEIATPRSKSSAREGRLVLRAILRAEVGGRSIADLVRAIVAAGNKRRAGAAERRVLRPVGILAVTKDDPPRLIISASHPALAAALAGTPWARPRAWCPPLRAIGGAYMTTQRDFSNGFASRGIAVPLAAVTREIAAL